MQSDSALVSCIMPTRNRRHLVGQAIAYFLRQDYPRKELIVVDDGEDCIADLVPNDPRLRYIRLERRTPLGAKRNLACYASRGELIAHWDDDDWMAPDRLSRQVSALLAADAVATGARDVLYYRIHAGDAWLYHGPADAQPWPVGGTLVYRRQAWEAHAFDEIGVGEDTSFVASLPSDQVHASVDSSFYVGLLHADNAAPKHLTDPTWQARPLDEVTRLFGTDRAFYAALRSGRSNGQSLQAQPPGRLAGTEITVAAEFDVTSGYGSMAEYLCVGLARAGAQVRVLPLALRRDGLSVEFQDLLAETTQKHPSPNAPLVYFSWLRGEFDRFQSHPDLFINTMWESSALPTGWAAALNRARAVIVPTRFVARVCRESGVQVPIEVIPEGIDPAVYTCIERPTDRALTSLIVGPLDDRKHVAEGIAAWKLAFADDPDARLIVKTQFVDRACVADDPRIRFVEQVEPSRGIAYWYAQADVFLALGNEGFGLPLVEAMATGLPVIALESEGQADVCADAAEHVLPIAPAAWEAHDSVEFGRCGVRGVPDVAAVAEHLHWVATHRQAAREMGRAAAHWAARERNVWRKGPAVLDVMERYAQAPRPLRRTFQVWVSSWRTRCGVAEHTAYLAEAMPPATGLRVAADAPDLASARVLHVQHQYGLYDEAALVRTCTLARQTHVPVVVTEHMVRPDAPSCEREADVLVSMSSAGVDMLRQRWPAKRVEYLPHGCPTWFPRRKRRRGRVIGAFGFMGPHKGFSKLLELVRERDDLQLLLFSATRSVVDNAPSAHSAGVRWETRFLPVQEIATRLAAEADVLVFWYDEIDFPTVSGAVRVGLGSGVPVLTSPTSWFADLREVTYQPAELEAGVRHLLDDTQARDRLVEAARTYCHEHSWTRIAERHVALWRSLEN
jgi:glycosyltransferase involved in cell wall biosynthesis